MMRATLYYIQNKGFSGNCLIWWKDGGHGYTSNLDEAWIVSYAEAKRICKTRPDEDFPRKVDLIDRVAVRHVTQGGLALALAMPEKPKVMVKA